LSEELSKTYDPNIVEQKWYKTWEENGYFTPDPSSKAKPFVIVIPPPNVTGSLHMGHALDNTIQDILIRFNRMRGLKALWVPGTDHAGIATQNVVEKELAKEKKRKEDIGREKFVEMVWNWKEKYGGQITMQLRRLGASCDWTRERFTMDEGLSRAVKKAFVALYDDGLIYRGKRIINWCPRCKTAISDIEVEYTEENGKLWYLKYPVEGTNEFVTVATTRPETMLGDTAVAVNPNDARYKHFIGKMLVLPLVGRRIPVIKDNFVDPSFGTGAVKVTPAHDPNDYEIGLRHNLPQIIIMHHDGKVNVSHFPKEEQKDISSYEGVDRIKLRDIIVADLEKGGYLEKIEDYKNKVGRCYRCKTIIEPYLSDQWFIRMKDLVRPSIQAVEEGKISYIPDRWTKVYLNWMENHRDWCISRQIWWGHRIPAWTCECGHIIVSEETPKKCDRCGSSKLVQDPDVLDTWFSSSLWPFSTLGWPASVKTSAGRPDEYTGDLKNYYPTTVLVTGYDIITFWVSKMIVMGLKFMKKEPFSKIFIHGLIRDVTGKKMSKSLGNVIDPINVIDRVGADALRFALISLISGQGQDIKLSEDKITEARNFSNKIWNAARYILGKGKGEKGKGQAFADKWILSRFNRTIDDITSKLEEFDMGEAARKLYDFIWSEFCDWYLEMSKIDASDKVLVGTFEGTLRLLHPFMPFITEEIWQKIKTGKENTIMLSQWPKADKDLINEKIEEEMAVVKDIVRAIRNIRATLNIPHSKELSAHVVTGKKLGSGQIEYIRSLARLEKFDITSKLDKKIEGSATAVLPEINIYVPLKGIIDLNKEVERLKEKTAKLDGDIAQIKQRISSGRNIPEEVMLEWKGREKELTRQKGTLTDQIDSLSA
jgi:valyl-tRNA synthetase